MSANQVPQHSSENPGVNVGESLAARVTRGENPWEEFFGPRKIDLNPYDAQRLECLDLPNAYIGKNYYLTDIINNLILTGFDWYTTVALPTEYTDQINLRWNEVTFNRSLVDEVPERGVARLVTSSSRQFSDRQVRRGIALMLEHGFLRTPEGQEHYRRQLVNIANSVKITNAYDVLSALLAARRYDIQWELNHGIRHNSNEFLKIKKHEWAVLQKSEHGFDIMVESAKKRMQSINGVTPNVLILPPKAIMYIAMKAGVDRRYSVIGPAGQQMMRTGASLTTFRGLDIFETQAFDLFDDSLPVQLLSSDRQIGSYFTVTTTGTISIYDEDGDKWDQITGAACEAECGVGRQDADTPPTDTLSRFRVRPVSTVESAEEETNLTQSHIDDGHNFALFRDGDNMGTVEEYISMYGELDPLLTGASAAIDPGDNKKVKQDISGAEGYLILRPYQTYEMNDCIMMESGAAGKHFVGANSFTLSDDGTSGITYGTFNYYSRAVVKDPRKLMVIENIFSSGYKGGSGTKWIRRDNSDEENYAQGDLICLPLKVAPTSLPNPLIIGSPEFHACLFGGKDTARRAGLETTTAEDDSNAYGRPNAKRNRVCWQGKQKSTVDGLKRQETGPWGTHGTYEGCCDVRAGFLKYMDPKRQ